MDAEVSAKDDNKTRRETTMVFLLLTWDVAKEEALKPSTRIHTERLG